MPLSPQQLNEILQIIRDASATLAVTTFGYQLTQEHIDQLVADGWLTPEDAKNIVAMTPPGQLPRGPADKKTNPPSNTPATLIGTSYELGRLAAEDPNNVSMDLEAFKRRLKSNPIPLSNIEVAARQHAVDRAGQYCVALGNRYEGEIIGAKAIHDAEVAKQFEQVIKDKTEEALIERHSISKLTTNLRQATEDWARDWQRIATTEMQLAHEEGMLRATAEKDGPDAPMAKVPEAFACDDCKRLYLDADQTPLVKPLKWWLANGLSNHGRKRKQWLPVYGPMHPWCRCRLVKVPKGFVFDDKWDLIPKGMKKSFGVNQGELKKSDVIYQGTKPPPGFIAAPHSAHGAFRKRVGNRWEYWYPEHKESDATTWMEPYDIEKKERTEEYGAVAKVGGEYSIGHGKHAVILPDASHPGKFRISEFDNRGFYSHKTYDTLDKLKENLHEYNRFTPSPGKLDELASHEDWHTGTATTAVVQTLNSLSYVAKKEGLGNEWADKVSRLIDEKMKNLGPVKAHQWLNKEWKNLKANQFPDAEKKPIEKARKLHGRRTFRGMDISIENRRGSVRRWYDPHEQREGETKMRFPYGYIRLTEGADGEHLDCYVGPDEAAKFVYIVHQRKAPDFKTYDEDKVMLGFSSKKEAVNAYLDHYTDPKFLGHVTTMLADRFAQNVKNGTYRDGERIKKAAGSARFTGSSGQLTTAPGRPVGTGGFSSGGLEAAKDKVTSKKPGTHRNMDHYALGVRREQENAKRKPTSAADAMLERLNNQLGMLQYPPKKNTPRTRPEAHNPNVEERRERWDDQARRRVDEFKTVEKWPR